MRLLRVALVLAFGLAMVGPEAHACPVHSNAPAHHQDGGEHQKAAHCTCPQACCPSGVSMGLPATPSVWTVATPPTRFAPVSSATSVVLPTRKHVLPLALAPPHALA